MADNGNGESKFGFKDRKIAEETLQLLESHEMQYRKLTVRGLLGRAKRVLSMTKAEDKIKNINEAIGVFEKWLEENGGGTANKNAKTDNDDKVETVPGLGFKDKEAAERTLKILEGRDPDYQRLAVKGLIGSSKRVLSGTKNEDKIKAIQEGVEVLEDFLEKFETENRIKDNKAYLAYSVIEKLQKPDDELALEFLEAYGGSKAKGNYKHLRTMYPKADDSTSWDIIRNQNITDLLKQIKDENAKLFDSESGEPTSLHLQLIHWAYSPQPDKVKAYVESKAQKAGDKRKADTMDQGEESSSTSATESESEDESPKKKRKSQ